MADGQTQVQVMITQGEDKDPDYVNKIAMEAFKLPANRPANRPINVTYSYDVNQRMHCKFEDEDSGEILEVDFCVGETGQLCKDKVEQTAVELEGFKVQ